MTLPLYKCAKEEVQKVISKGNTGDLNLGLYFQKFCDTWDIEGHDVELDKFGFLDDIEKKGKGLSIALVKEQIERMYYLTKRLGGKLQIYELTERFVTGVGLDHPLEVGFLWNHILGVPYLPGSSIKGLVRTWVEEWLPLDESEHDDLKRIFGSLAGERESKIGSVIFFDALPFSTLNFQKDIMTPHYTPYYADGEPPGDWTNPTPIHFLTLNKKQRFIFFVAPRTSKDVEDSSLVVNWLEKALSVLGAGAKTAVGYGSFIRVESAEEIYLQEMERKELEKLRKEEMAKMSPIRRQMEDDGYSTNEQKFMNMLSVRWMTYLERDDTDESEKKEVAHYLAEWYKEYRPEQWKKPKGKNIKKVRKIKKYLG